MHSQERIAKKKPTMAISLIIAKWESRYSGSSAPDRLYIPRKSLGVMARCRLVEGSAFAYAWRSVRTTGRKCGAFGLWKGLCWKLPRNAEPRTPVAVRTVFATIGRGRSPSGWPALVHRSVRRAWRKALAKRLCSSKDKRARKGSPANPMADWNPIHRRQARSLSSLLLSWCPIVIMLPFAALPRAMRLRLPATGKFRNCWESGRDKRNGNGE